jgi:DNA invertase Pin-like site-specific DNA recombinase
MVRVLTYHRVSTVDQDPTLARAELRAHAARLGELAFEIEETGSGARNDRPGLRRVLEAARRGQIDIVLTWKLDRFGRSALDVLGNIRELVEVSGVRFVCSTQAIDIRPGGDPLSRLLLTMLAAVAEFERDLIRERTALGMARARAAGKHVGRPRGARDKRPRKKGGAALARRACQESAT